MEKKSWFGNAVKEKVVVNYTVEIPDAAAGDKSGVEILDRVWSIVFALMADA